MNLERAILVSFLGNYLINNFVAALVALIPASTSGSAVTPQYITYVVLAAIFAAVLTWWHLSSVRGDKMRAGIIFGVVAFVVSLLTAFVTGVAGVLAQTGSLSQMIAIVPNFGPFLASWSTLVLLGYWLIPAALIGWWMNRGSSPMM
ncbi:hypothetical protein HY970_00745 [Candidatus Kaiserbacteria bacterium]|nr:hypothetical protein [Candidatus Kaiserbacteria bacterium]